jgi:hypothetical protein
LDVWGYGAGILCIGSSVNIMDNSITGNSSRLDGGGLYLETTEAIVKGNIIFDNIAWGRGGGIACSNSNPIILNNTVSGNMARLGAGILCQSNSNPFIINTILWQDSSEWDSLEIHIDNSSPEVSYCDVQGGYQGIGNIDLDPLFRDPDNGDFHLMSIACGDSVYSPCIDAGHPAIIDSLLDCSRGLGIVASDMGAYGGGDSVSVGVVDDFNMIPDKFDLFQNYPNPFNASTTISFTLPQESEVTISIYNLLGQRVSTILEGRLPAGEHNVVWKADDYPSGVYFARLEKDERSENVKMILLK